jgi:hypothetical protein
MYNYLTVNTVQFHEKHKVFTPKKVEHLVFHDIKLIAMSFYIFTPICTAKICTSTQLSYLDLL